MNCNQDASASFFIVRTTSNDHYSLYRCYRCRRIVYALEKIHIVRTNHAVLHQHAFLNPCNHVLPVIFAEQNNRERFDAVCLYERQRFEQLVHSAETARQNDVCDGIFHEHYFTNKKIPEIYLDVRIGVGCLLFRQLYA